MSLIFAFPYLGEVFRRLSEKLENQVICKGD